MNRVQISHLFSSLGLCLAILHTAIYANPTVKDASNKLTVLSMQLCNVKWMEKPTPQDIKGKKPIAIWYSIKATPGEDPPQWFTDEIITAPNMIQRVTDNLSQFKQLDIQTKIIPGTPYLIHRYRFVLASQRFIVFSSWPAFFRLSAECCPLTVFLSNLHFSKSVLSLIIEALGFGQSQKPNAERRFFSWRFYAFLFFLSGFICVYLWFHLLREPKLRQNCTKFDSISKDQSKIQNWTFHWYSLVQ